MKPKFAMYWASGCGGCEISLLEIHDQILRFAEVFEIVFCPCLVDGKKEDLAKLGDGAIDLTFFNGAIRNQEDEDMARLLRTKSRILVAYGSCAMEGCVPGLSNLSTAADHFEAVYLKNHTTVNPEAVIPGSRSEVAEGILSLPVFAASVRSLDQVVAVDYLVPGCPPEGVQVEKVIETFVGGSPLPPSGSLLGAGERALCEECPRVRNVRRPTRFYRAHQQIPEEGVCLLEQGFICLGPATRSGCGARCPRNNMVCIGCYGPPPGVDDQGAQMIAALGSMLDPGKDCDGEVERTQRLDELFSGIVDPAGTFYTFSLAKSMLGGKVGR
ncbi:MAG: oxidoreductase [Proteobacteria bacterium]|nr:oxidoreductase [Pseudomonadota bacterium]MBU1688746.1 oxidoreductase [Pseudomonadota bacterium]